MVQNQNTPQSGNSTGLVMGGINIAFDKVEIIPSEIQLYAEALRQAAKAEQAQEENSAGKHAGPE